MCTLPVLSAQLMTAPTGKAKEIRNFPPADPPRPEVQNTYKMNIQLNFNGSTSNLILLAVCFYGTEFSISS